MPVGIGASDVDDEYKNWAVLYLNSSGAFGPRSPPVTGKSACYSLLQTPTVSHMQCDTVHKEVDFTGHLVVQFDLSFDPKRAGSPPPE